MKKVFFLLVFTLQFSWICFSQDTLHRYTDPEVIKLADYIKDLEKRTAEYSASHPNDVFVVNVAKSVEEKQILTTIINDSLHRYNDSQVIKIAKYIQHLEKLDSLNSFVLALEEKRVADSIAQSQTVVVKEQKQLDKYEKQIFFNFDSSTLKEESYSALDDAVKILKSYPNLTFVIEGHTDSIGPVAYNLNLSKERADAVMNYFISKGISASTISAIGYGEDKPISTNETEKGRSKNRRVEIKLRK